jgi:cellobiose-specific phosphotransferase system component IIC
MVTRDCPRCGKPVSSDMAFCPFCGAKLDQPLQQVNTHSYGWVLMSFLVSFLWFKINNTPTFPIGFVGGLVITFWSSDIDKALGKEPLTWLSVVISLFGMFLGFLIR